jgi:large subunit GTPase 1
MRLVIILFLFARKQWADYLDKTGTQYAFFSAADAAALQDARRMALETEIIASTGPSSSLENTEPPHSEDEDENSDDFDTEGSFSSIGETSDTPIDPRVKVLTVLELEDLFLRKAPNLEGI